jgi:hypothetical protein
VVSIQYVVYIKARRNSKMHWTELKKQIYFEDGSLRDICVLGTTMSDWEKWVELVNKKYQVEFWDSKTELTSDKIDFAIIREYWDSNGSRETISARIRLDSINVMCYFFDDSEIENDVAPPEIKSLEDHIRLINYLNDISISLDKEVIVTDENTRTKVLLKVRGRE